MNSKKLDAILKNTPPATVADKKKSLVTYNHRMADAETGRIVAEIPKILKKEIKNYIDQHGITERIVILQALKLLGFNIKDEWLVDKRSTR